MAVSARCGDLICHQSGVGAVSADEVAMCAALDDRPVFQDDDAIGIDDTRAGAR